MRIAKELNLSPKILSNCLDPDYLPHVENYGSTQFVLLRLMEPEIKYSADTVQELTTKVALFISESKVFTLHRLPLAEITRVQQKVRDYKDQVTKLHVVAYLLDEVSLGLNRPITDLEHQFEKFEEQIFKGEKTKSVLTDGYYIKRKASAFKKVMKFTIDILATLMHNDQYPLSKMQEVRYRLERNLFYADDIFENVQSVLNLHIAVASQKTNEASFKTNEIVRVLTVLTIFFSPLNFLTGLYGMNFEHIPFLKDSSGFWGMLVAMALIAAGLLIYVLRRGWLAPPPSS